MRRLNRVYRIPATNEDGLPMLTLEDHNDDGLPMLPAKKKVDVGSAVSSALSGISGIFSSSQSPSAAPLKKDQNLDLTKKEDKDEAKKIFQNMPRQMAKEYYSDEDVKNEVTKSIQEDAAKIPQGEADPIGHILKSKEYTGNAAPQINSKRQQALNGAFTTGDQAKGYLQRDFPGSVDEVATDDLKRWAAENTTKQIAVNRLEKERKVEQAFTGYGTRSLEDAALNYAMINGDENVRTLYEKAGGNIGVPKAMKGEKMLEFLMNPDVHNIAKKNQTLERELDETIANFPVEYPEEATKLLAQAIAKRRDEKGLNSSFTNIVSKESTDKIMDELIAEGHFSPMYRNLYAKTIRPKLGTINSIGRGIGNAIPGINKLVNEAPIPTPGFLENLEVGAENIETSLFNSTKKLGILGQLKYGDQQTYSELEKQYSTPYFEPSSTWQKVTMHGAQMIPFVASVAFGGQALNAANLIKSPELAQSAIMVLATHGDNEDKASVLFPNSQMKQFVYTGTMDILNGVLGKYLPGQQIPKLLVKGEPLIADALKAMVDGKITTDAAKNTITRFVSNTVSGSLKGGEFTAAIAGVDDLLSQALQGKGIDFSQTAEKTWDAFKTGTLSTIFLAGAESALKSNKGLRDQIISMAEIPEHYKELINKEAETNPELAKVKDDIINNLDYIGNVYKEASGMPEKERNQYVLNSLAEKVKLDKAEKATDPTIKKRYQQEAKDLHEIKDAALKGIPEEKVKENQAIKEVKGMYNDGYLSGAAAKELETINTEGGEGKFDPDKVVPFLKQVAEGTKKAPEHIQNIANDMFPEAKKEAEPLEETKSHVPQEESAVAITQPRKTGSETTQTNPQPVEPVPAETEGQPNQPTPEATQGAAETPPPKEPAKAVIGSSEGGNKVGVSHSSLTELSKKMGLKEPERGEYLSPQWYADRGRKLLAEGANPNEVDNPNNTLHDRISIARAHLENLVKSADGIAKSNPEGVNSKEYQDAWKRVNDYAEKVKGLGTDAHRAMTSLQGERDIDTDSFTAVKKNLEEDLGEPASKEQEKKIKDLTDKNEELRKRAEKAEADLVDATNKAVNESEAKEGVKDKAKGIAARIRKAKLHRPGFFSVATPASIVWDGSVEIVAKAIEAGGSIADAIQKGVKYMQSTDWYKKLTEDDKKEAETQFTNWHKEKTSPLDSSIESLWKRFVDKDDNEFTKEESKAIWDYAKKNYLDKGIKYRDMITNVMNDTGLSWRQVVDAITPKYDKYIKSTSDAMWKKQADYRKNQAATKNWIEAQSKSLPLRALRKVSQAFRGVAVFGHGGIFIGTHAGMTLFNPSQWHVVIPAFIRAWKFAYGNRANYERRIEELKNSPNYVLAQRAGLKNNPDVINTEEFQKSQQFFKKIGGEAGVKGFNAIKVLRQDLFDYHYNRLSEVEKNDPQSVQQIARLVNNATGATNLKLPEWVNEVSFAGGMEAARWGKLTRNPARATAIAIKALITPSKATTAERVFAKVWARRVGEQLGTMAAMFAVNAAIQNTLHPNNPVNVTNPDKSDYLKFKFGDITIDPTSGMRGSALFAYGIGKIPFESKKQLRGDTRTQAAGKQAFSYGRGKLAPLYSTMADFFAQSDFNKNPLPFSNDKPGAGHHKLTWGEYLWEKAPLPVAHAAQEMYHSALDNGADKVTLNHILDGVLSGALSGGTGFRVGEYDAEEADHSPFTKEDKQDPTFKFYLDKGMELPNVNPQSEKVKKEDLKNKSFKEEYLSDQPKEKQEEYKKQHKEFLKEELKKPLTLKFVYVDPYGHVHIEQPGVWLGKKKDINELSETELSEIEHEAQSSATQKTKEKLFPQYLK